MIAEIVPGTYDALGKQVSQPRNKRYHVLFAPTLPLGRYLNRPLSVKCSNLDEVHCFLRQCRYVSDLKQFGQRDYWMPPEDFEIKKKGDCEDFALWTWRQLMALGYEARLVLGTRGRYGSGHAWVTFTDDERIFLVEPCLAWLSKKLPRFSVLRYKPELSVTYSGDRLRYFEHQESPYDPAFREALPLICEWIAFTGKYSHKIVARRIRTYISQIK
ncbi:MAG: hypothetical protein C4520_14280 [Candidatus Abyssobacteria bacterium SURF_5]|uniref:Transglutaminase-like domain-containing protein n=1 Tax=Abyssobacteria bacterium (strain SURF_5) TaxID=2093360 RepID=A0A3A4NCD9_ABYX5|nr:MAG: hypothetical protein C4520_14280 [Candidatus Abyssubacteria bacterium SURF_5]